MQALKHFLRHAIPLRHGLCFYHVWSPFNALAATTTQMIKDCWLMFEGYLCEVKLSLHSGPDTCNLTHRPELLLETGRGIACSGICFEQVKTAIAGKPCETFSQIGIFQEDSCVVVGPVEQRWQVRRPQWPRAVHLAIGPVTGTMRTLPKLNSKMTNVSMRLLNIDFDLNKRKQCKTAQLQAQTAQVSQASRCASLDILIIDSSSRFWSHPLGPFAPSSSGTTGLADLGNSRSGRSASTATPSSASVLVDMVSESEPELESRAMVALEQQNF